MKTSASNFISRLLRAALPVACVTLFAATTAHAQIVWTYLDSAITASLGDTISFSIGSGGSTGSATLGVTASNFQIALTDVSGEISADIIGSGNFKVSGTGTEATAFIPNDLIDGSAPTYTASSQNIEVTTGGQTGAAGPFTQSAKLYLGLTDNDQNYGWALISFNDDNTLTLYGFAYESSNNIGILAGAIPEPSVTPLLAALAAGGAVLWRRRSQKKVAPVA